MSIASAIFERSADTLAATHDDDLVLLPGNVGVSGYVQDASEPSAGFKQFKIGEELITHIVHIRRSKLSGVALDGIISIRLGASDSYRVRSYKDDPNKPEISFHCTL